MSKVVGRERGGRRSEQWGVVRIKEEGDRERAKTSQVVNGERNQGYVVGIDGVDDSLRG
jgi:hypothetical protein